MISIRMLSSFRAQETRQKKEKQPGKVDIIAKKQGMFNLTNHLNLISLNSLFKAVRDNSRVVALWLFYQAM